MWQAILNVFERPCLLNKLGVRASPYTVSMNAGEKMLTYTNLVRQLASSSKSMSAQVDDAEAAMTILNRLPEQYSGLIVTIDTLGNDIFLATELVKSKLCKKSKASD